MQDAIIIGVFFLALVILAVASLWIAPDSRASLDHWTTPWPA